MNFVEKLSAAWQKNNSLLCVGLDPAPEKLPAAVRKEEFPVFAFNRAIIDATAKHACAFKPQFAYYAGSGCLKELGMTLDYLRVHYPDHVTILDAKRNDIGSTAEQYAKEAFEIYGADAVTVNPYMGGDTIEPFSRNPNKGVFVLCRTSNPGAGDLQSLDIGEMTLFEHVARLSAEEWNGHQNIGLVAGATWPDEIGRIRRQAPELPLLVPGIGAQGGDLENTLKNGLTANGTGLLINSSRGIIYAGNGDDFAAKASEAARDLNDSINKIRKELIR